MTICLFWFHDAFSPQTETSCTLSGTHALLYGSLVSFACKRIEREPAHKWLDKNPPPNFDRARYSSKFTPCILPFRGVCSAHLAHKGRKSGISKSIPDGLIAIDASDFLS